MSDVRYRQTQIAWPVILPLVVIAAIIFTTFKHEQMLAGLWLFAGIWGVGLLLFATLTVTVDGDSLLAAFGVGLVRKRVWFVEGHLSWLFDKANRNNSYDAQFRVAAVPLN